MYGSVLGPSASAFLASSKWRSEDAEQRKCEDVKTMPRRYEERIRNTSEAALHYTIPRMYIVRRHIWYVGCHTEWPNSKNEEAKKRRTKMRSEEVKVPRSDCPAQPDSQQMSTSHNICKIVSTLNRCGDRFVNFKQNTKYRFVNTDLEWNKY